jgi:hypothetical protein
MSHLIQMSEKAKQSFQEEHPHINILNGIQEISSFSISFFSKTNINNIQNAIINEMFKRTGKIIEYQNEKTLVIIMRGIYLQQGGKTPTNRDAYIHEFQRLNNLVVDFSITRLEPIIKQQIDYLKDIDRSLVVIDRPVNDTVYGTRSSRIKF